MAIILEGLEDGSAERTGLRAAFNKSLHALWYSLMGISLFAGALSVLIRTHSLDGDRPAAVGGAPADIEMDVGANKDGSDDVSGMTSGNEAAASTSSTTKGAVAGSGR